MVVFRLAIEGVAQTFALLFQRLEGGVLAAAKDLADENGGHAATDARDHLVHLVGEQARPSGGQRDRARGIGLVEIEDVAPVIGRGHRGGDAAHDLFRRDAAPGPRRTGDVDLIMTIGDAQAKFQRLGGTGLPDHAGRRGQIRRGLEREGIGIAPRAQFFWWNAQLTIVLHAHCSSFKHPSGCPIGSFAVL